MNITKRGKHYQIREMRNGKNYIFTLDHKPTKQEVFEIVSIKEIEEKDKGKSVYKACIDCVNSKNKTLSPSTLKGYYERIEIMNVKYKDFMELDISKVTNLNLQEIVNDLSSHYSPKSVREFYSILKTSLDMFLDKRFKVVLPMRIKKQGYIYKGHIGSISRFLLILHTAYNLPHYSLHKLRHYYCSMMMTLGVPSPYIMEQGGWATDRVMKSIYTHTFPDKQFAQKGIDYLATLESP